MTTKEQIADLRAMVSDLTVIVAGLVRIAKTSGVVDVVDDVAEPPSLEEQLRASQARSRARRKGGRS